MVFGDHVRPAATAAPAQWISGACTGAEWTVGALVPNKYPCVLRVSAPDPSIHDWWSAYRDLFGVIASIGERYTSSPDQAWFAVWEGHGFDTDTTRAALRQLVRFDLPTRTYYLLTGAVSAATQLDNPGSVAMEWRNPDLFWPEDRRWFVATDVDFWSIYIGGDREFTTAVASNVGTDCELVGFDLKLEAED